MAQDETAGGIPPTDIMPRPGAPESGATGALAPSLPLAATTVTPKDPTRTAMDITPDDGH